LKLGLQAMAGMLAQPLSWTRRWAGGVLALAVVQLAACSTAYRANTLEPSGDTTPIVAPARDQAALKVPPFETWQHYPLPGKQPTEFSFVRMDDRQAVAAVADMSASLLRHRMRVEPGDLGSVKFSWKVAQLIEAADMALREADDSPVRIILTFAGDRSLFSMKNSMLSELSQALTGEPLPYATLMYVWCNTRPSGSVIINPRTDRIRKMVVESGKSGLRHWHDYERNIRSDFEQAFHEAPGALVGIAIMTDSDNTRTRAQAWYGPVALSAAR
jgi:hypothetical protein